MKNLKKFLIALICSFILLGTFSNYSDAIDGGVSVASDEGLNGPSTNN